MSIPVKVLKDFDKDSEQGCSIAGCEIAPANTIYYHAECHIKAPLWPEYTQGTALLVLRCSVCAKVVMVVAIADDFKDPAGLRAMRPVG